MNIIVQKEYFSPKQCKENPQNVYIFGENQQQKGTKAKGGGQAVIRPCDNAFGFCTKEDIMIFWSDKTYNQNVISVEKDIKDLLELSEKYTLVFPINGLGTGLSMLPQMAPKSFLYLSRRLLDVFGFNNIANLKSE